MLGRTAGALALAASALTAQAILLPPGVASVAGPPDLSALAIDTTSQAIKLPCSDCVFPTKEGETAKTEDGTDEFWIQGGANDIVLNFTLSEDGQALVIDGYPLYPPSASAASLQPRPHVDQVDSSASLADVKNGAVNVSPLRISEDTVFIGEEALPESGGSIIHLTYQILGVEGQKVSVDGVRVVLIMDATGQLMIANAESAPAHNSIFDALPGAHGGPHDGPHHPEKTGKNKECDNLPAFICKWRNAVESKMDSLAKGMHHKGGCHGKKGGKPKHLPSHVRPGVKIWDGESEDHPARPHGHPEGDRPEGDRPHHGHHGHHGPHGPHAHHRHHRGRLLHRLIKGFVMVLIPVMAGITVGMTVSLVGMLVGRLITFCWIKFRRGGQRGYASVSQVEEANDKSAENDSVFVEESEPLPVYEAAPAYVEKEGK